MRLDDLVQEKYDCMSENDRRIWKYVCRHREECRTMSLHELADACEVSHVTVSRFLRLIGLDGYSEFKTLLKWSSLSQPVFDQHSVEQNSFNLSRTINLIQQMDCTELFDRMTRANRLYAYGSGSVQKASAKVLRDYLILTECLLNVIEGKEECKMAMRQMQPGDVVFLFSLSGENPVMNDYARELRDRGMVLVAICQDGANHLSKLCPFHLPFFTKEFEIGRHGLSYDSSAGMFVIAEMLVLKYAAYQAEQKKQLISMKRQRIRLVATDMDGTLLDDPEKIPEDFTEWVLRHPEIQVVIASGRQYFNLQKLFSEIEDKLIFIAENGGIVIWNQKTVYLDEMAEQDVKQCLDEIRKKENQVIILCGEKSAYMMHASQNAEQNAAYYYEKLTFVEDLTERIPHDRIVKIAVYFEEHDAGENYDRLCGINERIQVSLSGECWIDLSNKTVNKGNALKVIQEKCHISRTESMAFGDYLNDYELLLSCEESYAMENAHPDLKKIAKYIAPSNRDRGVQKTLFSVLG